MKKGGGPSPETQTLKPLNTLKPDLNRFTKPEARRSYTQTQICTPQAPNPELKTHTFEPIRTLNSKPKPYTLPQTAEADTPRPHRLYASRAYLGVLQGNCRGFESYRSL